MDCVTSILEDGPKDTSIQVAARSVGHGQTPQPAAGRHRNEAAFFTGSLTKKLNWPPDERGEQPKKNTDCRWLPPHMIQSALDSHELWGPFVSLALYCKVNGPPGFAGKQSPEGLVEGHETSGAPFDQNQTTSTAQKPDFEALSKTSDVG